MEEVFLFVLKIYINNINFLFRTLIKRAQGRKRILKVKNFKRRHFCLTNQKLSYSKNRGDNPLYEIPIEDILAVETLQEESFKMKYVRNSYYTLSVYNLKVLQQYI